MCDSGNFKKYGAFGESAYSIIPRYSGESGNSDTGDTGDLGNTGGSEKSDDSDYFCTMSDSGISEESGAFSDYIQSHRSDGDFGSSGVGCEEYRFSIRTIFISKKQYEQISEYICIKEIIRTNI